VFDGGDLGGELKDDPVKSRIVVESLLEPFLKGEVSEGRMRIVEAHDDVARRIFSVKSYLRTWTWDSAADMSPTDLHTRRQKKVPIPHALVQQGSSHTS
jgi:hypothetical protein